MKHVILRITIFVFIAFCWLNVCLADSIPASSVSSAPGTSLDALNFADFGLNPAAFFFTGNSMYDYKGEDLLNIIAAELDPSQTNSLSGVPTTSVTINLDTGGSSGAVFTGTSQQSSVPEPATIGMALAGLGLLAVNRRVRNRPACDVNR